MPATRWSIYGLQVVTFRYRVKIIDIIDRYFSSPYLRTCIVTAVYVAIRYPPIISVDIISAKSHSSLGLTGLQQTIFYVLFNVIGLLSWPICLVGQSSSVIPRVSLFMVDTSFFRLLRSRCGMLDTSKDTRDYQSWGYVSRSKSGL